MGKRVIYVPKEKEAFWERFKKACVREGRSMSTVILKEVEQWMVTHEPGNPQTAISSFSEGGKISLSNIEGRVRQLCLERTSDLHRHEILGWIKERGVMDGGSRVAMTGRVIDWLKTQGRYVIW